MRVQKAYERSPSTKIVCGEGRTQQQWEAECNINNIMLRFAKSGELPVKKRLGQYLDTTEIPDTMRALEIRSRAEEIYESLPDEIKRRYSSWQELVQAVDSGVEGPKAPAGSGRSPEGVQGTESPTGAGQSPAVGSAPGNT